MGPITLRIATPARRTSALLLLAVLWAPLLGEIGHTTEHAASGGVVHDEATHPDAAAYVEQEEHDRADLCPACLHAGHKATDPILSIAKLTGPESDRELVASSGLGASGWSAHPPRAPPA